MKKFNDLDKEMQKHIKGKQIIEQKLNEKKTRIK